MSIMNFVSAHVRDHAYGANITYEDIVVHAAVVDNVAGQWISTKTILKGQYKDCCK